MEIKTFRAGSLHEALNLVRAELGSEAAVLQTREVRAGWLGLGRREIEVVASADVQVPSRLPPAERADGAVLASPPAAMPVGSALASAVATVGHSPTHSPADEATSPPLLSDYRRTYRATQRTWNEGSSVVADLCGDAPGKSRATETPALVERWSAAGVPRRLTVRPPVTADLAAYTELLDAEFPAEVARELIDRALADGPDDDPDAPTLLRARVARLIEQDLATTGPLEVVPGGRRVVALVGPTGVGKTTTIAKLAAHYRIHEQRRVALITVDTYRIAAVEQLRTYAEILDLPLQVVTAPRDMGQAVARLADAELVLIDTAGRSPCDEVRIHELRAYLQEARADDVQLVLSAGGQVRQLAQTTARFAVAGVTAILLTKLDESAALGSLFPWLRACGLPLSYLTSGQNVPQDIEPADRRKLARRLLDPT